MEKVKRHDRMRQKLSELCEMLPYNEELKKSLDSQTILRLALSTMRAMKNSEETREFENFVEESQNQLQTYPSAQEYENLLLHYSQQFFIVFDQSLTIFYLSSNSNQYINTINNKLIGQSLSKIIYSEDLVELNKLFQSLRSKANQNKQNFVCYCRLKSPIKKVRNLYNTIPGYKLYKINGSVDTREGGLVHALCKPVFIDEMVDRPMEEHIFITLLSVDTMSILYQDQRARQYTEFDLDEVKGQSAMTFLHASFIDTLGPAFVLLFEKGEAMTDEYLSKSRDGWIWLRSRTAFYHETEEDRKEGKRKIMITIAQVLGGTKQISTAASHKLLAAKALPMSEPIQTSVAGPIADPSLAPMAAQFSAVMPDPMLNQMQPTMQVPVTPTMTDPLLVRMPMTSSIPGPIMDPIFSVESDPSLMDIVPMLQDPTQPYSLAQYDQSQLVANTHTELPLFDVANSVPSNATSVSGVPLLQQLYGMPQQPQRDHIEWNPTFGTGLFVDRDINFRFSSAENVNTTYTQLQPINQQQFQPQPAPTAMNPKLSSDEMTGEEAFSYASHRNFV